MTNTTTKQKETSIVEYGLKEIQILKFSLQEIEELNLQVDDIQITLNLTGDFSEDEYVVDVTTSILIYKSLKDKLDQEIAELKVKCSFDVRGFETLKENGGQFLPKNLIDTFNAISVSTTRGILFTKFQGTNIKNVFLPLIDHTKFNVEYTTV